MTTTVLKLSEAVEFLKKQSIRSIKDVRALDVDLLFVLASGERIILSGAAMQALSAPETMLQFADGQVALGRVFQQIDQINVSPEANLTVSSKEITRYNLNNTKTDKAKQQDEESDKPVVMEEGEKEAEAAQLTSGVAGNTTAPDFSPVKSPDSQQQMADVEINSQHEKNWGVQWPLAAGALALLATSAGGGGGGGAAAAASNAANPPSAGPSTGTGVSSQPEVAAVISGAAMLGPLNNAYAIAYDDKGNLLSEAAQVVDGRYSLVLNKTSYRGAMLIVIRDNTPGEPDNYADEASRKLTDLGSIPLRALVNASGSNQTVNVSALTELAAIKAGLEAGAIDASAVEGLTPDRIAGANNAVGGMFKVDVIAGDVVPTTALNAKGQVISNPGFNPGISSAAYNYGAALKAISNLVQLDNKAYPTQMDAIQKLADSLQFVDASNTALKWATNSRGLALASSNLMQSHLFSEPLQKIINDPNSQDSAVESAQARYKVLQDLPGGSSVAAYLQQNHVAIAEPRLSIKHALTTNPELWQSAPTNATLELDQGDFLEGGLGVSTPPYAAVNVVLEGRDNLGRTLRISFPAMRADEAGQAILAASAEIADQLLLLDPSQPVSAEVTVVDGYNTRTNYAVWKNNADVRVDLNTPPGMTHFAAPAPALVTDSSYAGRAGDDPRRVPAQRGDSDKITFDGSLRVSLTKAVANDERLQFAVAISVDDNGQPVFGSWKEAGKLVQAAPNAKGGIDYIASEVVQTNGSNWVKARVVLVGAAYTGGYGNANNSAETLQFTLDTVAPPSLNLQLATAKDDGLSTSDGVTGQRGVQLVPVNTPEAGGEVHFRLVPGNGTDARTLQLQLASGASQDVVPGSWYELKSGDRLLLNGDTINGNGKVQLLVRQIDAAGNFSENTQRFVVDSSGLIQYTVLLANSEKAVNDALAAANAAQTAFDTADAGSKSLRQAGLAAAQTALARAQAAQESALEQARAALINGDGTTRLDNIMGQPVEKDYVSAIINAMAATGDVDKVSDAVSLKALVRAAIQAADTAVAKAAAYGDDASYPAPTLADFKAMGIVGVNTPAQLAAITDILKVLPSGHSDSIADIQTTVRAYYKVLALADGTADNTDAASYPTPAEYAALGVAPALTDAGARLLGAAIDGKDADGISTVAKINALADAAQRIAQQAALPGGQALAIPLTVADFERLGVIGSSDDNVAEIAASLNSVPQNLRDSGSIVGVVDTLAEVQALVSAKIGSLQTILNYAKGVSPINAQRPTQREPVLNDYQNAELIGSPSSTVTTANLSSVNSAVKIAGVDAVSSWKKLAGLVQSYNLILASADGVAGNAAQLPAADDYVRIGVRALQKAFPTAGAARNNALSLLNQVLDGVNRSDVDSASKLDRLASVVARVLGLAAGQSVVLGADELNELRLSTPITAAQLPVVLSGFAGTADDGSELRSPVMVAEVAARALAASARIVAYADDVAHPAPVLSDYLTLGIKGIDDDLELGAINSALATPTVDGKRVGVPAQLQEIVDAYARILGKSGDVSGVRTAPASNDYTLIGATVPHDENTKGLVNSALVGKSLRELASVGSVNQLVAAANSLQTLAAGDIQALQGETAAARAADLKAKLELLGVVNLNDAMQATVTQAIIASPDDASAINTLAKLQALVDGAIQAHLKINAYADDANRAAPVAADYLAIGVNGVNVDNLGAINSALASVPVSSAQTATPQMVQDIVDAYVRILSAADVRAGNAISLPSALDYQRVGLAPDLVKAMQPSGDGTQAPLLGLLNTLVDIQPAAGVNTLSALSTLAGTAQHLLAQANGRLGDTLVTQAELAAAGLSGLDTRTFPAVLAAIAASPDDASGIIGTLPAGGIKLQALADNAHRAQLKIQAYADGVANAQAPTLADYRSVGIDLAASLSHAPVELAVKAINGSLRTAAVDGTRVNTPSKLADIVGAYDLVLAAVDGQTNADGGPGAPARLVTVDVLGKLGVGGLVADDPGTLALLVANMQSLLGNMTPTAAADVTILQASVDVLVKISHLADGVAGNAAAADRFGDALTSLQAAGVTISDATVAAAVADALDGVDYRNLASPARLQAMIDAYARILAEANETEPAPGNDYVGEDKVRDATPDSDPALADFNAIGAKLPGLTTSPGSTAEQTARLQLLDDVLKYKARSQVDRVAELNQIGQAVDQLLQAAAQTAGNHPALTDAQRQLWQTTFRSLGISGVDTGTDGNLELVLGGVIGAGADRLSSVAQMQALVNGVNQALMVIVNYAVDHEKNPAPALADYRDVGVERGANAAVVDASNLSSINSAIARLDRGDVDTRSKLKTIINAYNAILNAADGKSGDHSAQNLTPEQYLTIGTALSGAMIGMGNLKTVAGTKSLTDLDADKLGLFNSVVGAQSREGVATPEKLTSLAATAADLIRTARESRDDPVVGNTSTTLSLKNLQALGLSAVTSPAVQTAFLDAVRFKGNNIDPVTSQPGSSDTAATHDVSGVRSIEQLSAMATSYAKVLAYASGGSATADAPTALDYQTIGVARPSATGPAAASALALFNSAVLAQGSTAKVDTVTELNKLALTVDQLMQVAAVMPLKDLYPVQYPALRSTLQTTDVSALGLTGIDAASLPLLLNKLQTTADDGSAATSVAALQDMVNAALAAQRKIVRFARDDSGDAPTAADFDALGLQLPIDGTRSNAPYLNAINDALKSSSISAAQVQTPDQLQSLIIAAQHVVDAANGTPGDGAPKPNAADFLALGLDKRKIDNAGALGVAMLADTVDASTLHALTTDENGNAIALPDKLAGLLDLIQALMVTVAGGVANPPLDAAQLGKLGVNLAGVAHNADGTLQNWLAILAAIAGSRKDGSDVNTLRNLQTLVNDADASQDKIRLFADDAVSATDPVTTPSVNDYRNIGLVNPVADATGRRASLVTADNLEAINASLRTPTINAAQADSPARLKEVVDAYQAILSRANGALPDGDVALTAAQFKAIGSAIDGITTAVGKSTDGAVLSLLDGVISGKRSADVMTPAAINVLGALVNKVMAQAQSSDETPRLTAAELQQLGLTTANGAALSTEDPAAIAAMLYAIRAGADDGGDVNTLVKLQAVVSKAATAYHKIQVYAELTAVPGGFPDDLGRPNADDFKALGLKLSTSVETDKAVGAAATLLTQAFGAAQIDAPAKLQAILDNWDKLFSLVDGRTNTAALTDATRGAFSALLSGVGVVVDARTNPAALDILQTALDGQSNPGFMNTPLKLEGMLGTAQALLALPGKRQAFAGERLPAHLVTADLVALGVVQASTSDGAVAAVLTAVSAQAGSEVDSLTKLQGVASLATRAQAKIAAYAEDSARPAPTVADYLALGLVKADGSALVSADNLGALNSTLASTAITAASAADPAKLKTMIDAYAGIINGAMAGGVAPSLEDYARVGLSGLTAQNKRLLDGAIQLLGAEKVKDQAQLLKAAQAVVKIAALADGNANATGALPVADDYAALGLNMGRSSTASDADGSGAALLSNAIDAMSLADVNTTAKLQAMLDAVNKLMDSAARLAGAATPAGSDLQLLGVDISARTSAQQGAILAAIGTSGTDGSQIRTIAAINALVQKAVDALAKISAYAQDNTGASLGVPTVEDYTAMGVFGISSASLPSINAALATPTVNGARAATQPLVQGIANAYLKILAAADGSRADIDPVGSASVPTAGELELLGVNVSATTEANRISLLSTALDALSADKVDTPADIDLISLSAARLVAAAGRADAAALLTMDDFNNLGVQGLDAASLSNVQALVASHEISEMNTSSSLQALVDGLLKDLKVIRNYADGVVNTDAALGSVSGVLVPTVENYARAGVTGVDADLLASINASVRALGSSRLVDSKSKLQAIVEAYRHVLQGADGVPGNLANSITRAELLRIGVPADQLRDPAAPGLSQDEAALARASFSLLSSALDAQPADKSTVATPAKIADLASIAGRVAAYAAGDATVVAPTSSELAALGVKNILAQTDGSMPSTVGLIHSGLKSVAPADLPTLNLQKLQTMATAAAKLRSLAGSNGITPDASRPAADAVNADGTPQAGAPLTYGEFRALGMDINDAPANLKLLNEVFDNSRNFASVADLGKITSLKLVDIVNRVMRQADLHLTPNATSAGISLSEWTGLGLIGTGAAPEVSAGSTNALMAAIKALTPAEVDTMAELKAVAAAARAAQDKIRQYAEGQSSGAVAPAGSDPLTPTAKDFGDMGVSGIGNVKTPTPDRSDGMPEGLFTVLSALATSALDGKRAATADLVQGLVDSVNRLLALADGRANTPGNPPSLEDLRLLGADLSSLGKAASKTDYLSLLDSVIDRMTADKVDTPAEIMVLANLVAGVLDCAGGQGGTVPTRNDLERLGVTGLNDKNMPAVLAELQQVPLDGLSAINTLPGLQSLVSKANAAQDKIRDYAADSTRPAPTAQDYADMAVVLPNSPKAVADSIVAATNQALASAPIGADQADTPHKVQAIVNSYARLLQLADGSINATAEAMPVAQDFINVGVDKVLTDKLENLPRLLLLNQLIDGAATTAAVDSPARLNALAIVANKLLDTAAQQTGDAVAATNVLSAEDFSVLGISGMSQLENDAVISAFQSRAVTDVDTVAEIRAVATSARAAINRIVTYADRNSGDAPTMADYLTLGVTGVSEVGAGANKDAINAALATSGVGAADVGTVANIQARVDTYQRLMTQADGTPSNTADSALAKQPDFERIGVDLSGFQALDGRTAGATANMVQLLSSTVDSRSVTEVNTPAKIAALAAVVNKVGLVMQGESSNPLTAADFSLLKITGVNNGNLAKVQAQIRQQADDGHTLNTWAKLADVVFSVTNVPTINTVAADDVINLAERTAGVTLTGTAGKDDTVTLFYPDGSVMRSAIATQDSGTGTSVWNWSYTLTDADWRALGADGANGVVKTISIQSRNTVKGVDSIKVNHTLNIDTTPPVFSKSIALAKDSGEPGDRLTNDGRVLIDGLEAGASWAYKIDDAPYQPGANGTFTVTDEVAHVIKVRQTDSAGNDSVEQELKMTLDKSAPAKLGASLGTDSVNSSNSNSGGSTDRLTNDGTVNVVGLEKDAKLEFSLDNGANWTTGSGASVKIAGAGETLVPKGSDGAKSVLVRQTDKAGNVGAISDPIDFTLDTTPPGMLSLSLAQDTSGKNRKITSDGTVTVAGLESGAAWEYSLDGGANWLSGTGVSYKFASKGDGGSGSDGAKNIKVRQVDAAGNIGQATDNFSFTLDSTKPAVPTFTLANNAGGDNVTKDGKFNVTGLEPKASWQYSLDNGTSWTSGSTSSFTLENQTDGSKTVIMRQIDEAGNVGSNSDPVTITLDTTPPAALTMALARDAGTKGDDRQTKDGTIDVTGLERDATWEFSLDSGNRWKPGSDSSLRVRGANTPALPTDDPNERNTDGEKIVLVRQTDKAGNLGPASSAFKFNLDTTPPAAPTLALKNDTDIVNDRITRDGTIEVSGLETGAIWEFSTDKGVNWTRGSGTTFEVTGDGPKVVTVHQIDLSGNQGGDSTEFSFTLDSDAPQRPVLSLRSSRGTADNLFSNDNTINVGNLEKDALWKYSLDGGVSWTNGVRNSSSFTLSGEGDKRVIVQQSDAAGNVSANSEPLSFKLDTIAPAKPVLSLATNAGPSATDDTTNDGTVKVDGLEAGASWQYSVNGGTMLDGSGSSIKLTGDGAKAIRVQQTDTAGNTSELSDPVSFILDTILPAAPTASLALVRAVTNNGLTKLTDDGTINVSGVEAGAIWQYSLDGTNYVDGSGTSFKVKGASDGGANTDGVKKIQVRQMDLAGNFGPASVAIEFTLDTTAPSRIGATLGTSKTLASGGKLTNDGTINIGTLEASATWQYSIDNGVNWLDGSGTSVRIKGAIDGGGATDGDKSVWVRQVDQAGNPGQKSDVLSFRLDTTVPDKLTLALATKRGEAKDIITNDGTLNITGLETNATWQYSTDDGLTWSAGSGTSVKLTGDGSKKVVVRQTDLAGNHGDKSEAVEFTLDSTALAPSISLNNPAGSTVDGASITTGSSFTLSGVAEKGAQVVIKRGDGVTLGNPAASSTDGSWSLSVTPTLTVSGLKKGDGTDSSANGTYSLLSSTDQAALLNAFSGDFLAGGTAVLDLSKPVYSFGSGASTWYVWAALDGGYIISRKTGTDEWYREGGNEGQRSGQPENAGSWNALSLNAQLVQSEMLQNGGVSGSEVPLTGVSVANSNGASDTAWRYTAEQTDIAGNLSPQGGLAVLVDTTPPPLLDMDAVTPGMQAGSTRQAMASELRTGVAFAPGVVPPSKTTASAIDVVFSGAGLDLGNDRLLLDARVGLDANLVPVSGKTVGGVADVSYVYTAATRTLSISKTRGGTFAAADVEAIVEGIKLQNLSPSVGTRIITINLRDDAGLVGPAMQATLNVSSDGLMLDLDTATAGLQQNSSQSVTDLARLASGVAFDASIGVPTSTQITAIKVALGGAGFDPSTDRLQLDTALVLNRAQPAVDGKTIGGIGGLNYAYDNVSRTLTVRKSSNAVLTGAEVQAILQSVKLAGTGLQDGTRSAQFSLVSSTGENGGVSTASLLLDTQAPTLDADSGRLGLQTSASKSLSAARMIAGEGLFPTDISVWPASDINSIAIRMGGTQLDLARDKLVLDAALPLNANLASVTGKLIGGIAGLSYGYDASSRTLTISKSSGAALNGLEARAILKAVQIQNGSPTAGDRSATIVLTDKAGNSASTTLGLNVDLTVPSPISAELIAGKQLSYRVINVPDILGSTNRHNLTGGEDADLSSILPSGMSSSLFLSSLRAISSEWGGLSITNNANTTSSDYLSVYSFARGVGAGELFTMAHQGSSYVKGGTFKFSTPDAGRLTMSGVSGFYTGNTDVYALKSQEGSQSYDIGNLHLLYEVATTNVNSMPVVNIRYNGTQAVTGDMLALYEGDKLLGRRVLTDADVGRPNSMLAVSTTSSLGPGDHVITPKFIDLAGNVVNATNITVSIPAGVAPTVTNLQVIGEAGSGQAINDSPSKYAMISETPMVTGVVDQNLTFTGTVGRPGSGDNYLVTIFMGGKVLAFDQFAAGDFSLTSPANILAPGMYKDLTVTVTNISPGTSNGLTTQVKDQSVGWYWVPQNLDGIIGGGGDDLIALGVTSKGIDTLVQTGVGKDTLMLSAYGNSNISRLAATVTDFTLGQDKVAIYGQTLNKANLDSFVKASSYNNVSTKLVIDLDGAGPGTSTYNLYLQNVQYNPNSIATIFGV
jgi:hypothetical protein